MARRGGVKRMSANIYADIRVALKQRLERVRGIQYFGLLMKIDLLIKQLLRDVVAITGTYNERLRKGLC